MAARPNTAARDPVPFGEGLMTKVEAARFLGLSPFTMNKHAQRRIISSYVLGRELRFRRSDLEAWLKSKRRERKRP